MDAPQESGPSLASFETVVTLVTERSLTPYTIFMTRECWAYIRYASLNIDCRLYVEEHELCSIGFFKSAEKMQTASSCGPDNRNDQITDSNYIMCKIKPSFKDLNIKGGTIIPICCGENMLRLLETALQTGHPRIVIISPVATKCLKLRNLYFGYQREFEVFKAPRVQIPFEDHISNGRLLVFESINEELVSLASSMSDSCIFVAPLWLNEVSQLMASLRVTTCESQFFVLERKPRRNQSSVMHIDSGVASRQILSSLISINSVSNAHYPQSTIGLRTQEVLNGKAYSADAFLKVLTKEFPENRLSIEVNRLDTKFFFHENMLERVEILDPDSCSQLLHRFMIELRPGMANDQWTDVDAQEDKDIPSNNLTHPSYELEIQKDWLLPRIDLPFTEPDIYEQVLARTWSSYMMMLSEEFRKNIPVNNVNCYEEKNTINLSEIFPRESSTAIETDQALKTAKKEDAKQNVCEHCGTDKTSLWRRRGDRIVCNACALYEKLHGVPRPAHLLNQAIRRRNRTDSLRRKRQ
ncbi:hypothetical protein PSACC_02607 [Paramicrosporidium saccamoebae]|uniref:GATA-type domain-containing protein n=1 Tax=Paramicrosporidium saccamoebae TaxID=1246581 RepID=A0A2H9TIN0_9FUNG|nr:hypothetical protein PSACC_02607 [Paramicrosporidium saccamoebae]